MSLHPFDIRFNPKPLVDHPSASGLSNRRGVLSIHRSIQGDETISRLKEIAREQPGRSGYNSGDQGIINKWIHADGIDLGILPYEYNLIKKDYTDMNDVPNCRLLHYCDRKPWFKTQDVPEELEKLWFKA